MAGDYVIEEGSSPGIVDGSVFVGVTFDYKLLAFALPAGNPDLNINPAGGPVGTPITIEGSGFAAKETIQIYVNGLASNIVATTRTDGSGLFSTATVIPQLPAANMIFSPKVRAAASGHKRR